MSVMAFHREQFCADIIFCEKTSIPALQSCAIWYRYPLGLAVGSRQTREAANSVGPCILASSDTLQKKHTVESVR